MKKRNSGNEIKTENETFGAALGILLTIGLGVYLYYGLGTELLVYAAIMILLLVTASFL